MESLTGTGFSGAVSRTGVSDPHELSQDLRTALFYLAFQAKAPACRRGLHFSDIPWQRLVLCRLGLGWRWRILGVLAAEALDATGSIHQLLLAGKKRMASRADFHGDVSFMGGARNKGIAARAMHAHFF